MASVWLMLLAVVLLGEHCQSFPCNTNADCEEECRLTAGDTFRTAICDENKQCLCPRICTDERCSTKTVCTTADNAYCSGGEQSVHECKCLNGCDVKNCQINCVVRGKKYGRCDGKYCNCSKE